MEQDTRDKHDTHMELLRSEFAEGPKLICTECGGEAQGNFSWTDGSGEICDACVKEGEG